MSTRTRTPMTTRTALAVLGASALLAVTACSEDLPDQGLTPAAADAAGAATPTLPAGGEVQDNGAELDLEDQSGDGSAVVVEEVGLSAGPGLVVVTRAGSTSPIGAAVVGDGGARDLTVVLSERLTGDEKVRAVLYVDVDEDGSFDPAQDSVVVDEEGDVEADDADYRLF
jgi:hypothetical protein